jgi:predicted permease
MKGMRPLVAAQLALSVVVVFAAVLLGRTLMNFARLDPGFAVDRLVTVSFDAHTSGFSRDQMPALGQRLTAAARRVPGATSAAVSTCGLVANCSITSGFRIEGGGEGIQLHDNWVGPGYFTTVGIPIVSGREFDDGDTVRSPRAAIITESIAQRHFQGRNPIGKRLGYVGELDTEIVGVVRDVRSMTLRDPPIPMVYFPIDQPAFFRTEARNLDVRVATEAGHAALAVSDAIRRAEPALLIDEVGAMSARLARDVNRERIVAYLAAGFAILVLFLASVGLFAVLSCAVAGRTQEIGVRMALGARSGEVVTLVVRDALNVVAAGVVAGLVAAFAAGRLLKALLFHVSVLDPVTHSLVLGMLVVVTVAAAYIPARRAARVDPILALRNE